MRVWAIVASLLATGCSTTSAPHETPEEIVEVLRLTPGNQPLELKTLEMLPVRRPDDVLTYFVVQFRVLSAGTYHDREIALPILLGSEGNLWKIDHFVIPVPVHLLNGEPQETWIDGQGRKMSALTLPFSFDRLVERGRQAATK